MKPTRNSYSTCLETYSTLRIFSNEITPAEISSILLIEPSKSFCKDELLAQPGNRRKFNGWFLSSESKIDSNDTTQHTQWVITSILGKKDVVHSLRTRGAEIDICCYWVSAGQGGPTISPSQMRSLGDLDLEIWWDVYFETRA